MANTIKGSNVTEVAHRRKTVGVEGEGDPQVPSDR